MGQIDLIKIICIRWLVGWVYGISTFVGYAISQFFFKQFSLA